MKWTNSLQKDEEVPLLNFEGGPGVPLSNFRGSQVPLSNFEVCPQSQVPGFYGPGALVLLLHHACSIKLTESGNK